MKQMVCEMCGGTDLIKQDGVFVCQTCGTKYSIEEAKKMMIEGNVDVSGSTVKVDDTGKVENYMMMANNAYASDNNKEAESYCNKIIEIDPTHSEAWLLKGIVAGWQTTGGNIRMDEFISCVSNALTNATSVEVLDNLADRAYKEYYKLTLAINKMKVDGIVAYSKNYRDYIQLPPTFLLWGIQIQMAYGSAFNAFQADKPEEERAKPRSLGSDLDLDDVSERCEAELISGGIKLWNASLDDYNSASDGYPTDYMLERMMEEGTIAMLMVGHAIPKDTSKITDSQKANIIKACKNMITMKEVWINLKSYTVSFSGGYESHPVSKYITMTSKQEATAEIRRCHEVIKICDPSYEVPVVAEPKPQAANSGGCYVATAVYGSYDCPQVWTLRRYRDYDLAESWYGRTFIRTYYAISPTLVKWFGHTEWFKKMWRGKLDRMVKNLQDKGYESTPYEDRDWR